VQTTQVKDLVRAADQYGPTALFADNNGLKNFISVLCQYTSLEYFSGIYLKYCPQHEGALFAIDSIVSRNRILKRANALLEPHQPWTGVPIASKSGIWCVALAKMAESRTYCDVDNVPDTPAVPTYPGISAIFKIF
jgi:hypothetical protein